MSTKKKFAISIATFAVVILAVVIAIVAVLAAQDVTVKSSVSITYTADAHVLGSMSASYKMQDNTTSNLGTVNFAEAGSSGSLSNISKTFSTDNQYIDITFAFTNTSETFAYTATVSYTDNKTNPAKEDSNIKFEYSTNGGSSFTQVTSIDDIPDVELDAKTGATATTNSCVIRISLGSTTSDAEFSGEISWNLVSYR